MLAAAFLGAVWGAAETLGRAAFFKWFANPGLLLIPQFSLLDALTATVLSGFEYAVAGAFIGFLASVLLAPLLRVVTRKDPSWCAFVAPRFSVVFFAIFFNLFWWTRFLFHFAYSEHFYSPKRMLLSVVLALVAIACGVFVTKRMLAMPRLSVRGRFVTLLVIAVIGIGFYGRERVIDAQVPSRADAKGKYNVVFVIVDTLRADRLGCYGYSRPTSPRIDRIAAESTLFERAVVQAPYTWTSFGSYFTGKYPRKHGLLKMDPTVYFSPKTNLTLQKVLQDNGYRTGAFLTGMLSNASGLLSGFETYLESMVARDVVNRRSMWSLFRSELVLHMLFTKVRQALDKTYVADEAVDWIGENRDARFFALVHLYSTHTPYDPGKEHDLFSPGYKGGLHRFTNEHTEAIMSGAWKPNAGDVQRINDLYDGAVHEADAMVGGIYEYLTHHGLIDDTVFVVAADHGEELGEHDLWEHNWMYNTNQRVPLIVKVPNGVGRGLRVDVPVEAVDVMPTILDLLGIASPTLDKANSLDGHSLTPWLRGQRPYNDAFAHCENVTYLSVQNRDWKLIRARDRDPNDPPRFFDLASDPGERVNLYPSRPPALDVLEKEWQEFDSRMPEVQLPKTAVGNSEIQDLLRQNGYIGARPREGVFEAQNSKSKQTADPQSSKGGGNGGGAGPEKK